MSSQEREALGCSQRENRCYSRLFPSHCATISSLALCTLIVSSLYLFVSFYMAKSKKKSSILRFAQQDYGFRTSRPSSSQAQRTLSWSSSPGAQHSSSLSRAPDPPRTTVALVDVVNFKHGARVWVKNRNRGMQSTPPTILPLSSPGPCGQHVEPSVSTRPCHVHFAEADSLGSNLGSKGGVTAPPPPLVKCKASSGSHRPSSPVHPTGSIPLSPLLVHFYDYTASTSCHLLGTDLGVHKDLWRFSLIGYIAGKFLGYTSLSKFINSSWKCSTKFSMHDFGWLIFTFSS